MSSNPRSRARHHPPPRLEPGGDLVTDTKTPRPAVEITADLRAALRARYRDDDWERYQRAPGDVLLEEVTLNGRSADAIRVGCWSSRGYSLEGFELKATRSDWLRELKNPAKADVIAKYLDRWWVVAPAGIVKKDELPVGWGLMELRESGKLVVKVQAPKRDALDPSRYVVAMLTRAGFMASRHEMKRAEFRANERARKHIAAELKRSDPNKITERQLENLKLKVAEFEAAAGFPIEARWDHAARTGRVVKWVLEHFGDIRRRHNALDSAINMTKVELRNLEGLREALVDAIPVMADGGES